MTLYDEFQNLNDDKKSHDDLMILHFITTNTQLMTNWQPFDINISDYDTHAKRFMSNSHWLIINGVCRNKMKNHKSS